MNLPMLAVVGSQSTGTIILIQEKVPFFKASSENNFSPKEKALSHVDPSKFNSHKSTARKITDKSLKKKDNTTKPWSSSAKLLNCKLKKLVDPTKESAPFPSDSDFTQKKFLTCF